ncbi:MAG: helix-turn-helix domain-containing protein [Kiritimatiellae bacterium]|jgi:DNA-binding transcriptional regulator YiaG|nr:helix-turn-helix domain-containing protein [Kiritimatiellia bacterium]MDY0149164.1 helix-turn-helix domain-containing protein [Kiritimatiellia bacterium]
MSNVMKELKAEIARVSRRQITKELAPIKRINAAHRSWIADLRRQLTQVQKQLAQLNKAVPATDLPVAAPADAAAAPIRFWITGKGVRNLRQRLGLTQAQFGKLAGVSGQTIVNWEATKGKISLRRKDMPGRLQEIRKMKKRDVQALMPKKKKRAKTSA